MGVDWDRERRELRLNMVEVDWGGGRRGLGLYMVEVVDAVAEGLDRERNGARWEIVEIVCSRHCGSGGG